VDWIGDGRIADPASDSQARCSSGLAAILGNDPHPHLRLSVLGFVVARGQVCSLSHLHTAEVSLRADPCWAVVGGGHGKEASVSI
jgi:hypothetical protein